MNSTEIAGTIVYTMIGVGLGVGILLNIATLSEEEPTWGTVLFAVLFTILWPVFFGYQMGYKLIRDTRRV